jgi:hypothetical protein
MNTQRSNESSILGKKKKLKNVKIPSALKHCVRDFWVRWLKPDLKLHPQICISEIYQELAKLKDVSIKKLKNLVFTHVGNEEKFNMVQQIYKEILEIFKRNPNIEKEYPKHTSLLKKWFKRILHLSYEDMKKLGTHNNTSEFYEKFDDDKEEEISYSDESESLVTPKIEEGTSATSPLNTNLVIPVPYEYLVVMQNQISHLISIINSMSTR